MPQESKMSILEKIAWRIKFLLVDSWGKDWEIIKLSLSPSVDRGAFGLAEFLNRKKIIELKKGDNSFKFGRLIFYYDERNNINELISDFISIWGSESSYIERSFLGSSAYYQEGPYEMAGAKLAQGDYVIDAGANIGLFSILASEKTGESGKVFSFEPVGETKKLLLKNIHKNKKENIIVEEVALGSSHNDLEFIKPENFGGSSGFFTGDFPKEKIKQTTLDDYVKEREIKKINFMKADIEGMERELIKGAEETIKKFKPKLAICIYHRLDDPKCLERLIKEFVPDYKIKKTKTKLYAWI